MFIFLILSMDIPVQHCQQSVAFPEPVKFDSFLLFLNCACNCDVRDLVRTGTLLSISGTALHTKCFLTSRKLLNCLLILMTKTHKPQQTVLLTYIWLTVINGIEF